ncbi:MAG: AmmeMemoRadiSam system protein A [Thermodesulfobacteriota bacterium]|nr:AmmeMemoRadiSam system protein A [Thermodesulfobacteriota bacterium]
MKLSGDERLFLLELARKTIQAIIKGKSLEELVIDEDQLSPTLLQKAGVFVTLHKDHDLRGCIGYILPMLPLWQAVMENARNAAFRDPRFSPLSPDELEKVEIEVSVLTEPESINGISEFRVGIDGIILEKGPYQAVFLPQVAPEQGWDSEATLRQLSMKAGLNPDGWKTGATFKTFQAIVFSEKLS